MTYYSPSGRRFRQFADVVRYLERQTLASITRDNFSFSSRCIVGEFIQPLPDSSSGTSGSRGIRLGEAEVRHLVDQIRMARGWKPRSRKMTEEVGSFPTLFPGFFQDLFKDSFRILFKDSFRILSKDSFRIFSRTLLGFLQDF